MATGSLVNVAEQRLKDTQSQGTLNSKQENINAMTRDFKHEVFDLLMRWNRVAGYARRHAG